MKGAARLAAAAAAQNLDVACDLCGSMTRHNGYRMYGVANHQPS